MAVLQSSIKLFFCVIILCVLSFSCRKNSEAVCNDLKAGVIADDKNKVGKRIEDLINTLPTQAYTQDNFNLLIEKLTAQCGIQVLGNCFDCVQTLPSQSEIWFSVNSGSTTITRTIDLSYTTANRMKFHNMHE